MTFWKLSVDKFERQELQGIQSYTICEFYLYQVITVTVGEKSPPASDEGKEKKPFAAFQCILFLSLPSGETI